MQAANRVLDMWNLIIPHFQRIIDNAQKFGDAAVVTARKLLVFWSDRKVILFLNYNLDLQSVFSEESLIMQETDSTIIGKIKLSLILK